MRRFIVYAAIGFVLFFIVYTYVLPHSVKYIDSVPIGVETILLLTFSFYYLYEQTNDTTTMFIYSKSTFWVILGIVLYLAGSFFIYIFADTVDPKEIRHFWFVTNILSILKNIFFCIAIYIHSRPPKEKLSYSVELGRLN